MTGALTQGTLHVHIYSASLGISTTGVSVPAAQITTGAWKEFIAPITPSPGFTTIPPDLLLRVYADGTPTTGAGFLVDNIEIFPTADAVQHFAGARFVRGRSGKLRRRHRIHERFRKRRADGARGVSAARAALLREGPLAATSPQDDGVNEPASWTINEVSQRGGHAVGRGRGHRRRLGRDRRTRRACTFSTAASRSKFRRKFSRCGTQINWAAGQTLWVRVDTRNKRILCGVPIGHGHFAESHSGAGLSQPVRAPAKSQSLGSVLFSTLSGKLYAVGRSRKWCPWNITANCCALAERADGTAQVFLGNGLVSGAGNGKIYQLSDTQFSDDGAAINSYYTTYFFLSHDLEQTYQVRSHRKLFAYLDDVRRRGRELEPLRVRRQRSVSHGAHAAAAVVARAERFGVAHQLARRARRVPGRHEHARRVVQARAFYSVAAARSVVAGAGRELSGTGFSLLGLTI